MTSSEIESTTGWVNGSLWDMTGRARTTTFIGAGGKTTCLQSLTQEIDSYGFPVIATTTTKVLPEKQMKVWRSPYSPPENQAGACFWYVKAENESGKWIGPLPEVVDVAILEDLHFKRRDVRSEACGGNPSDGLVTDKCHKRYWVIEGDGARRHKLKCWGPDEPQIPERSECAVLVLAGDLWGSVLGVDQVHRPECCPDLVGNVWQAESAWHYFLRSPVFTHRFAQISWVILLNRYGVNSETRDGLVLSNPLHPLNALKNRWTEIQGKAKDPANRPRHLRLAAGDAKEGKLQWFELW